MRTLSSRRRRARPSTRNTVATAFDSRERTVEVCEDRHTTERFLSCRTAISYRYLEPVVHDRTVSASSSSTCRQLQPVISTSTPQNYQRPNENNIQIKTPPRRKQKVVCPSASQRGRANVKRSNKVDPGGMCFSNIRKRRLPWRIMAKGLKERVQAQRTVVEHLHPPKHTQVRVRRWW